MISGIPNIRPDAELYIWRLTSFRIRLKTYFHIQPNRYRISGQTTVGLISGFPNIRPDAERDIRQLTSFRIRLKTYFQIQPDTGYLDNGRFDIQFSEYPARC